MRLTETVVKWLEQQEWEERPDINDENQSSSTSFIYNLEDFNLHCWFEVSEKSEIFKVYMYFSDAKVPSDRFDEVKKFINGVNERLLLGSMHFSQNDRRIRYYNAIDVEDASFEPQHITNMLIMAASAMEKWLPEYMAICFGGKKTDEVFSEE